MTNKYNIKYTINIMLSKKEIELIKDKRINTANFFGDMYHHYNDFKINKIMEYQGLTKRIFFKQINDKINQATTKKELNDILKLFRPHWNKELSKELMDKINTKLESIEDEKIEPKKEIVETKSNETSKENINEKDKEELIKMEKELAKYGDDEEFDVTFPDDLDMNNYDPRDSFK